MPNAQYAQKFLLALSLDPTAEAKMLKERAAAAKGQVSNYRIWSMKVTVSLSCCTPSNKSANTSKKSYRIFALFIFYYRMASSGETVTVTPRPQKPQSPIIISPSAPHPPATSMPSLSLSSSGPFEISDASQASTPLNLSTSSAPIVVDTSLVNSSAFEPQTVSETVAEGLLAALPQSEASNFLPETTDVPMIDSQVSCSQELQSSTQTSSQILDSAPSQFGLIQIEATIPQAIPSQGLDVQAPMEVDPQSIPLDVTSQMQMEPVALSSELALSSAVMDEIEAIMSAADLPVPRHEPAAPLLPSAPYQPDPTAETPSTSLELVVPPSEVPPAVQEEAVKKDESEEKAEDVNLSEVDWNSYPLGVLFKKSMQSFSCLCAHFHFEGRMSHFTPSQIMVSPFNYLMSGPQQPISLPFY